MSVLSGKNGANPQRFRRLGLAVRVVFVLFAASILAAVVLQDYTSVLPLGLVNSGFESYRLFSLACLVCSLAALAVLLIDLLRGRLRVLARVVRGVLFSIVILELLLFAADAWFAGRPDVSLLGGPYRELRTPHGGRLVLGKPNAVSSFGFRTDHEYQLKINKTRVLFLGDSYTEGSGSAGECNYASVVERVLNENVEGGVEVMNAGVSGYGPEEALTLVRELRYLGYEFDFVVYNFFAENDFTDNLPGTERRVMAGISFRFPESWFLRTFHPFNTRLVRWGLFADALVRFERAPDAPTAPGDGECDPEVRSLRDVSGFLRGMVEKGLSGLERISRSPRAQKETVETILAMKHEADDIGVPFAVVLFPDRVLADHELQRLIDLDPERLEPSRELRAYLHSGLTGVNVIDTADLLTGRAGMYRRNDTHLSDAGNVAAGEWVAGRLLHLMQK